MYNFLLLLKTIRRQGLKWFAKRIIKELRLQNTFLGKKIRPISVFIYYFFKGAPKIKILGAGSLIVFYDFEVSPITFDLAWVLCLAETERKMRGLKYIHMVFVPGPYNGLRKEMADYEKIFSYEMRHWRKDNLLFPLVHLLPSCKGLTICNTRQEAEFIQYNAQHIFPFNYSVIFPVAHKASTLFSTHSPNIMALKAPVQALLYIKKWLVCRAAGRKTITITLRQCLYMTDRNSNINAWADFAKRIDHNQYFVIIIPDTDAAFDLPSPLLKQYEHFFPACWNVDLRMALYESCYLNLGINNGPFALCWLNQNCRYVMYKVMTENVPQTNEETFRKLNLIPGYPPPFLMSYQKWVWAPDTTAVIEKEFKIMCEVLEKSDEGILCQTETMCRA